MAESRKGRVTSLQLSVMGILIFCLLSWAAIGIMIVRAFAPQ
jgi:hypothetical protein